MPRRWLVGLSALLPGDRILHSTRGADQDEAADIEIRARRDVEGHARSEGVAQEVTAASADRCRDGIAHQGGRRRQVGAHGVRSGVAGQVDADEGMILGQEIAECSPQAPGLGESVQKDHGRSRTRTALFDLECHAW